MGIQYRRTATRVQSCQQTGVLCATSDAKFGRRFGFCSQNTLNERIFHTSLPAHLMSWSTSFTLIAMPRLETQAACVNRRPTKPLPRYTFKMPSAELVRSKKARSETVSLVPAELYDVLEPPSGSVRLSRVASRAMQQLHPNTQRAFYAKLRDNTLKTKKAGAFEVAELSNGYRVVLKRSRAGAVIIEGVFEQGFGVPA